MRAIVTDSEMMDRTRELLLCISLDSTRASFTAATRPPTTATTPAVTRRFYMARLLAAAFVLYSFFEMRGVPQMYNFGLPAFKGKLVTEDAYAGVSAPPFHPILTDVAEGHSFTMLGASMRLIATAASTGGRLTVFEQVTPAGWGPPRHIHLREDEIVYVSRGNLRVEPRR
jgi:hypothetical protein